MAAKFLPEDIVDDIVVRLPVKSISRFESVCSGWQSKFRSPSFAEFYRQQKEKRENKSSKPKPKNDHVVSLNYLRHTASHLFYSRQCREDRKIIVIGPSSNGIYCLTSVSKDDTGCEEGKSVRIALCNPSIRSFEFLLSLPTKFSTQLGEIYSKGPKGRSRVFSGFGWGGSGYSVVVGISYKLYTTAIRKSFLFFLYTSKKRRWEIIRGPSSTIMEIYRMPVCTQSFLHGCCHWMARGETSFKVLSFNFARQSFDVISVPSVLVYGEDGPCVRVEVVVLHGHLALISWREADNEHLGFDVWMMMDYGVEKPWTNIFSILTSYSSNFSSSSVLYGIDYVEDRSERGGIRIKRLFFTDKKGGRRTLVMFCDRDGRIGGSHIHSHRFKHDVSFSTQGISVYTESLDRP